MNSAATLPSNSSPTDCPLVVDVDGTLVRSDLLWEGLLNVAFGHPRQTIQLMGAASRGRGALKELVAALGAPAVETLPLEPEVLRLIDQARTDGRTVLLLSGANEVHVKALVERVQVAGGYGSTSAINLTGVKKLGAIQALCQEFDYVGNAMADPPLWGAARRAYAVNTAPLTRWLAHRRRPDLIMLKRTPRRWTAWGNRRS